MPKLHTKIARLEKIIKVVPTAAGKKAESKAKGAATRALKKNGTGIVNREVKVAMMQKLEETDHMRNERAAVVPLDVEKDAICRVAGGESVGDVARDMDISVGYVAYAMKRRFGSPEAAKKALQGLVLENALACMVDGGARIGEMSGPQAIMSGAILTDKALALEKSMEGATRTIDFGQLAEMGKTLKVLRTIATVQKEPAKP